MTTPVCDFVKKYATSGAARFHMPGHKGSAVTGFELYDITEIKGAGELYSSSGPVGEGEENTATLFGAGKTCWVTEGSSQCIRAMIALAVEYGKSKTILAARNAHRAFITGCALAGANVKWLIPESGNFSLCSCIITPELVKNTLAGMEELPAAVYITSPDYLGGVQDIAGIAKVCHGFSVPLLVDNAHGAYLKFLPESIHPIDLGADMCCDSAHKTLPALTGCAYLHISKTAPMHFAKDAKRMLRLSGSTSPSWLLLQSLDMVNKTLSEEFPEQLKLSVDKIKNLKAEAEMRGWRFYGNEPLKLTIDAAHAGYRGEELADILREKHIECEYADPDYVVLMASPMNQDREIELLKNALANIPLKEPRKLPDFKFYLPERKITIRDASLGGAEDINVPSAEGRIAADAGVSCPPAVSVVTAGEKIDRPHIDIMKYYGIDKISVVKQ